ncbi:MAG: glycoside hydrolase family 130 protein [Saprospiraceae bacterium]
MNIVNRTDIRLHADPRKVILRFLDFGRAERFEPVVRFVLDMDETAAEYQLQKVFAEFEHRHFDLKGAFLNNYERLRQFVTGETTLAKKLLIGSYFTHEYSVEASALFNPSIVPHPDQTGLGAGELRFVMSLRATGEGHISSIAFLTGVIGAGGDVALDPMPAKITTGRISGQEGLNYTVNFDPAIPLPSRLLFPHSGSETNGMEDARFVHFNDGAESRYLGTYTAYNGRAIRPQLIETRDFLHFHIRPFEGNAASDKGMAIFPEKINGQYAMVGRQGGRSLSIMYSHDLYRWDHFSPLQHPRRDWEYLQMGNCGSPTKTPQGWLLLTHAVGPMRKYVLSASLLDLEHPEKVIASLDQPLLSPNAEEREGYVPNVLYTCGLLEHNGTLFIPYAMSDSAIGFATARTEYLIQELLKSKV